jgi:hypothetical protein
MILPNLQYPRFVPDQVLTSDSLDDLFTYLDDQDRMTRTNLIGIGIVCGLGVETPPDGTSIKITKGTGVTSEGYLVSLASLPSLADTVYTQYIAFDPTKEDVYDKFKPIGNRTIQLWELKESAAVEGATPLTLAFLNGNNVDDDRKVVMLFVELLKLDNKNCNPESCDDKGLTIQVNLRPLLVRKTDVTFFGLANGIGEIFYKQGFAKLGEMRMHRFDVTNSNVVSTADLFAAYKNILTLNFLKAVDKLLSDAWSQFKTVFTEEYKSSNPIATLSKDFAFVNDNSISSSQLQNLQYCYDHVSDVLYAYAEFREVGMEVLTTCCPDSALFPRHLLLDLANPVDPPAYSKYRHFFNYSPLFQKRDLYGRLRSLFHRLVVMRNNFKVPAPQGANDNVDSFLRITPSRLDSSPLSKKSIPYYYSPVTALYESWNYENTQAAASEKNLSYYGKDRPNAPIFVKEPLAFDLEPYNFLRVEGHIGKPFAHVLSNIQALIDNDRLPITVVALALGMDASGTDIADSRYFQEIQLQYEVLRNEILCCLKNQLPYWAHLQIKKPSKESFLPVFVESGLKFGAAIMKTADTVGMPMTMRMADTVDAPIMMRAAAMSGGGGTMSTDQPAFALSAGSTKGQYAQSIVGTYTQDSLFSQYLKYQAGGDFSLKLIPDPDPVLDAATLSQYALVILDEMTAISVLLGAETVDALDVDSVVAHSKTLSDTIIKLGQLIDQYLQQQRPFQKIKAYLSSPTRQAQVDRIADAMGAISDDTANALILLLLNLNDTDAENLTRQLQNLKGHATQQQATITAFTNKLDIEGAMFPAAKDITYVDDPVFKEMKDRLRNFSCLCGLDAFKNIQDLLKKLINELRQVNLFYKFSQRHPGLQHKAGVPMGGTFIVVYHQNGEKTPNKPDPTYQTISDAVPAGTVVADFYLPYLCCSNESPIVFQVTEAEPPPVTATLSLQPNPQTNSLDFSSNDEKQYAFTHTPDGGTLNNGTEANGVTTLGSDNYIFTPSKVQGLGNNEKLDFTFSYTKKGVTSNEVKVSVYALPTASITGPANTDVQVGDKLSFTSTVQFADKFNWTVTDGNGQSTSVSTTQTLDNWDAATEGVFVFSLAVTQSKTGAQAISNSIKATVKKVEQPPPPQPTKTCANLKAIVDAYFNLNATDAQNFVAFNQGVLEELGINAFFKKAGDVSSQPLDAQLAFFDPGVMDTIMGWLQRLLALIRNTDQKNLRLLSLETYRLLVDLVMYISCIQKGDQDVIMKVFEMIAAQLGAAGAAPPILALRAGFTAAEQQSLVRMNTDIKDEFTRQNANNEIEPKPNYTAQLHNLLDIFERVG